eukprot:749275-Rhodomonas_salina.2
MRELKSGILALKSGMRVLKSGTRDLKSGTRGLKSGTRDLKSGVRGAGEMQKNQSNVNLKQNLEAQLRGNYIATAQVRAPGFASWNGCVLERWNVGMSGCWNVGMLCWDVGQHHHAVRVARVASGCGIHALLPHVAASKL